MVEVFPKFLLDFSFVAEQSLRAIVTLVVADFGNIFGRIFRVFRSTFDELVLRVVSLRLGVDRRTHLRAVQREVIELARGMDFLIVAGNFH